MDQLEIKALLELKLEPFRDLGFAKVDRHRGLRQGIAEVIYGAGKTPEQIRAIAASMREDGDKTILITRMSPEAAELVGKELPCRSPRARAASLWPREVPAICLWRRRRR